jgi:hypothetical protein
MHIYLRTHDGRYDVFLELLNTPQEERSNKALDLCFQYIQSSRFRTDEMLARVDSKLLLGEQCGENLIVQALDKAEKRLRMKNGDLMLFCSVKDYILMRPKFDGCYEPRHDAVKKILHKRREERGESWVWRRSRLNGDLEVQ